MAEWQKTTLGELIGSGGSIKTGPFGATLKASEYTDTGVPVVSVGEIGYGRLRIRSKTPCVDTAVTVRLSEYLLEENDIVFARKGAVDRSALVTLAESGWFLGSDGIRVRLGSNVNPKFISYQLSSPGSRDWILRHASGSTLLSLNQPTVERVPICLPSIEVQTAVAEVLGALDDKIAANTRLAATVDSRLATLLRGLLLASAPTAVPLESLCTINSALAIRQGDELRYIDIASVGVGRYEFPALSRWDEAPSRARRRVELGDTIWSTVRPNRRSHALNLSEDSKLVASTGLAVLSPKTVGFAYLYEVTRRPEFSKYLETVAEGSAYPAVKADRFAEARVPLLSPELLNRFESDGAPLRGLVHSQAMESILLAETRDALLPALMSGKLRVKEAERAVEELV